MTLPGGRHVHTQLSFFDTTLYKVQRKEQDDVGVHHYPRRHILLQDLWGFSVSVLFWFCCRKAFSLSCFLGVFFKLLSSLLFSLLRKILYHCCGLLPYHFPCLCAFYSSGRLNVFNLRNHVWENESCILSVIYSFAFHSGCTSAQLWLQPGFSVYCKRFKGDELWIWWIK